MASRPAERLRGFLRYLRTEGFQVGVDETLDVLGEIRASTTLDADQAHRTVRSLACGNRDDWHRYETLFTRYWYPDRAEPDEDDVVALLDPRVRRQRRAVVGLGTGTAEPYGNEDESGLMATGAGRQKTLTRTDYRFLNDRRAMRAAERLAEKLARLARVRLVRRRVVRTKGRELDVRRTLRRNLSTGGLPVKRIYRERRPETPHLVILHDISHSMAWHNPLLYRFVRGLVRSFPASEAFAFHTRLFRVTDVYREHSIERMRERLEHDNKLWLGGTCIAESVRCFVDDWAQRILRTDSVVVMVSDGFDTDSTTELSEALSALRRRCKTVLWLNPMLGRPGYAIDPQTLLALRPYVDRFAPAHSLEALREAVLYIGSIVNRRTQIGTLG